MPLVDYELLTSTDGGWFKLDLAQTPIKGLTINPNFEVSVAKALSSNEWVVEAYRTDPQDLPKGTPINKDVYSVYAGPPSTMNVLQVVSGLSTNADQNLWDFVQGQAMFIKWADTDIAGHHLPSLPAHVWGYMRST